MAGGIYQSLTAINTEVGKEAGYKIPCSSFSSCLWGLRLFPSCPLTVFQYYRYVTSWRCLCFVAQAMMCAYSPPMVPSFPPRNLSLWYYTFNVCFDCQLADKLFVAVSAGRGFCFVGIVRMDDLMALGARPWEPDCVCMDAGWTPSSQSADSVAIRQSNQTWLAVHLRTRQMVHGYLQEGIFLHSVLEVKKQLALRLWKLIDRKKRET